MSIYFDSPAHLIGDVHHTQQHSRHKLHHQYFDYWVLKFSICFLLRQDKISEIETHANTLASVDYFARYSERENLMNTTNQTSRCCSCCFTLMMEKQNQPLLFFKKRVRLWNNENKSINLPKMSWQRVSSNWKSMQMPMLMDCWPPSLLWCWMANL